MDRFAILADRIVAVVMDPWTSVDVLVADMLKLLSPTKEQDEDVCIDLVIDKLNELSGVLRSVPINDLLRHSPKELAERFAWDAKRIRSSRKQYGPDNKRSEISIKNTLWKCEQEIKLLAGGLKWQKSRIEQGIPFPT